MAQLIKSSVLNKEGSFDVCTKPYVRVPCTYVKVIALVHSDCFCTFKLQLRQELAQNGCETLIKLLCI